MNALTGVRATFHSCASHYVNKEVQLQSVALSWELTR